MGANVDPDALDLAVQEGRRTVEEGMLVLERLQGRLESVLKLGIAETAGLIAVLTLLLGEAPGLSHAAFVLVAIGVFVSFSGLGYTVFALGATKRGQWLQVGATPGALRLRLLEPGFDKGSLQWGLLRLMQEQVDAMRSRGARLSKGLSVGTWTLLLSALLYLFSLGLIVGERMLG